ANVIMGSAGPASVAPAGVITHNGTGGYVLPAAGVYQVSWNLSAAVAALQTFELRLNGTTTVPGSQVSALAVVGGTEFSGTALVQAAANDVLSLFSVTGFTPLAGSTAEISIRRVS